MPFEATNFSLFSAVSDKIENNPLVVHMYQRKSHLKLVIVYTFCCDTFKRLLTLSASLVSSAEISKNTYTEKLHA